jgi:hypothetical protein
MSDTREELMTQLRALRRVSKGTVRAIVGFECHNRACAVQVVTVEIAEGQTYGIKLFQNPVRCVRCGGELFMASFDPR